MEIYKTKAVIIGAGPAGIAAAIQLHKSGIEAVVIERSNIGGMAVNAGLIDNYPGFPEGISGADYVERLKKQVKFHNIRIIFEDVVEVDYIDEKFLITTNQSSYQADYAIIATGTLPKKLPASIVTAIAAEKMQFDIQKLKNEKGKTITIIGAGDIAIDYMLSLTQNNKCTILNRSESLNCNESLKIKISASNQHMYLNNADITRIDFVDNMFAIENNRLGTNSIIKSDHCLVAIGRIANDSFLSDNLRVNRQELIDQGLLYFAGDVVNNSYRQIGISVGDGLKAAMKINETEKNKI